eukprot:1157220-Pelagomonas_calceolata.AAC.5
MANVHHPAPQLMMFVPSFQSGNACGTCTDPVLSFVHVAHLPAPSPQKPKAFSSHSHDCKHFAHQCERGAYPQHTEICRSSER